MEGFELRAVSTLSSTNAKKSAVLAFISRGLPALIRLKQNRPSLESGIETKFVQIALDGETMWKALGIQVLNEIVYEMSAKRTEHEIWARLRIQLQGQGIWLLHIDECQRLFQTLGEKETRKVISAQKTLMKHRQWSVISILSGIPELLDKVNLDPPVSKSDVAGGDATAQSPVR